jgi:hypothetical protein
LKLISRADLYHGIQNDPLRFSEKEISEHFDRARLDPRLMEVLTEFLRDFWWHLNPAVFNRQLKKRKYPYVAKAVLSVIWDHCEISDEVRKSFSDWTEQALRGIRDPRPQLLYLGLYSVGSRQILREIHEGVDSFRRHHLFAKDLPFNKGLPKRVASPASLQLLDPVDTLKRSYAARIKDFKRSRDLTNNEVMTLTGINRVFLSRILNNKLSSISVEYLAEHSHRLDRK